MGKTDNKPTGQSKGKPIGEPKSKPGRKLGKMFLFFTGVCVIALPLIIFSALSIDTGEVMAEVNKPQVSNFDHNAKQLYDAYTKTTPAYMDGNSTTRTLNYYYSLRQYPGSPPYITHELSDKSGAALECLSCHAKGGFANTFNGFTPVTPHPQHTACEQCHLKPVTQTLFREIDWISVQLPRLGRSMLAGSPPPIAHALQMRENCIACHVGPGTVVPIRVEHPMRGNCRQCHVPEETDKVFNRKPHE